MDDMYKTIGQAQWQSIMAQIAGNGMAQGTGNADNRGNNDNRSRRGGWDRDGGRRSDYNGPRRPGLFEQIDEMKQAQQQMQQQQQQFMQQVMAGPQAQQPGFMQPAMNMAFTPAAGQMTGPATPGQLPTVPQPPDSMPPWACKMVDQLSGSMGELRAKIDESVHVAQAAKAKADAVEASLARLAPRNDSHDIGLRKAQGSILTLTTDVDALKQAVGHFSTDGKSRESWFKTIVEAKIESLQADVKQLADFVKLKQRRRTQVIDDSYMADLTASQEAELLDKEMPGDEGPPTVETPDTGLPQRAARRGRAPAAGSTKSKKRRSSGDGTTDDPAADA